MDKKIRNRILYIAVACLWGIAIYRTIRNHQAEELIDEQQVSTLPPVSPSRFNKDTFELELPSKDPFLGDGWKPHLKPGNRVVEPRLNTKEQMPVPEIKQTPWPAIEYFGFVKNHNQNSTLCLLRIDNQPIKLSKGDEHNGILVQRTYKDSVLVMFAGETRMIHK